MDNRICPEFWSLCHFDLRPQSRELAEWCFPRASCKTPFSGNQNGIGWSTNTNRSANPVLFCKFLPRLEVWLDGLVIGPKTVQFQECRSVDKPDSLLKHDSL